MTWHATRFFALQGVRLLPAASVAFAAWAFAHRGHRLLRIHPSPAVRVVPGIAVIAIALSSFTNNVHSLLTDGRVHEADRRLHSTIGGAELLVALKFVVRRRRPPDAAGLLTGPRFPSGHTLAAVGLYGILAFLLAREKPSHAWHAAAVALLPVVAVLVPTSRVDLGVHWPYDTIARTDIGVAWLACLTMLMKFRADGTTRDTAPTPLRPRAFAMMTALVVAYAVVLGVFDLHPEARPSLRDPKPTGVDVLHAFPQEVKKTSEDLIGGPMEPLSFVTASPAYDIEQPEDFTFERSGTPDGSIRHRRHIRIWRWSYCLAPRSTPLWVATCSYDMGVKFVSRPYLVTHRIDPRVDREREFVAATLRSADAKDVDFITVTGPARGKNAGGDAFTTDGRAHVMVMPSGNSLPAVAQSATVSTVASLLPFSRLP